MSAGRNEATEAGRSTDRHLEKDKDAVRKYTESMLSELQEEVDMQTAVIDKASLERARLLEEIEICKGFLSLATQGRKNRNQEAYEFVGATVRSAARTVLERAQVPLLTREITDLIEAGGRRLGKSRVSQVTSALLLVPEEFTFEKVKGKSQWSLREWESATRPGPSD
jgi:hypothetical protein